MNSRFEVSDSDVYKTEIRPFDCMERLSIVYGRSFDLIKQIQEATDVRTIYFSELPFIYVKDQYRRFREITYDLVEEFPSVEVYNEENLTTMIVSLIDQAIGDFYDQYELRSNLILSINTIYVDHYDDKYIIRMKIDVAKVDDQSHGE